MTYLETISPWIPQLVLAFSLAPLLGAFIRLRLRHNERIRLRAALKNNWSAYLDNLSDNLEQMKTLRATLTQIHPRPDERVLEIICDQMEKNTRAEIDDIDQRLATMANAPDSHWYDTTIEWRRAPVMREAIEQLILLAREGVSPQKLEQLREEWTSHINAEHERQLEPLHHENALLTRQTKALEHKIGELEAELEGIRKNAEDAARQVAAATANSGGVNEEAIAARLMATLSETLQLEEIEGKIAVAEGQIQYDENQLNDPDNDEKQKEALRSNQEWMTQCKRWWTLQRKLRRQTILLDEATGRATDAANDQDKDRTREMQEFQSMEASSAELRQRVQAQIALNHHLTQELEKFQVDRASVEELRLQLRKVNQLRESTERELSTLEKMYLKMEDDIMSLRIQNRKIGKLEEQLQEKENLLKDIYVKEAALQREVLLATRSMEEEKNRYDYEIKDFEKFRTRYEKELAEMSQELRTLRDQIDTGEVEGFVPENEMMELQIAYDNLNSEVMKMKSAVIHAEQETDRVMKELARSEASAEALQAKYKSLYREYQEMKQSMIPEAEMMELQTAYDALNAEMMAANTAARQLEREKMDLETAKIKAEGNEAVALAEAAKFKKEYHSFLVKYKEMSAKLQSQTKNMVPEREMIELQAAYDALNADLMKAKAAQRQAQREINQLTYDKAHVEHEKMELTEKLEASAAKYKTLGKKYQESNQDAISMDEVMNLQSACDRLNSELKKSEAALKEARQNEKKAKETEEKTKAEYANVLDKYKKLFERYKRMRASADQKRAEREEDSAAEQSPSPPATET